MAQRCDSLGVVLPADGFQEALPLRLALVNKADTAPPRTITACEATLAV